MVPSPTRPVVLFSEVIPSLLEGRHAVIDRVLDLLEERNFDLHPLFDRLMLDELITNAILHGNKCDPDKTVSIEISVDGENWLAEITDDGAGFDWESQLRASAEPPGMYTTSGRGLALILALGSTLEYFDDGRRVVLTRKPNLNTV